MKTALDLSPQHAARFVRIGEYAPARGLAPHLLALALLLPERSTSPRLDAPLAALAVAQRERCARLFVRACETVEPRDLEDADTRAALVGLARSLATAESSAEEPAAPASGICIAGAVASDRIEALLGGVESAPLGSALPWLLAAELLGETMTLRGTRSDAPAQYRAQLLERLAALSEQSPAVFLQAISRGDETALRDALRTLADAVRGAASLEPANA